MAEAPEHLQRDNVQATRKALDSSVKGRKGAAKSATHNRTRHGYTEESRAKELAQAEAKAEQTGKKVALDALRGLYVELRKRMPTLPAPGIMLRCKGGTPAMRKALQMEKAGLLDTDILQMISAALHPPP